MYNNMNIINDHKYNEIKHILCGCRTMYDATYFSEIFIKKNPEMKNILYSLINGKRYDNVIDLKTMALACENLAKCVYKDDAENIVNSYFNQTDDSVQKKSLMRIVATKSQKLHQSTNVVIIPQECKNLITKKCPHCDHLFDANVNTTYVICGYTNSRKGFDWKGCRKDWCFKCCKILCKSWDQDHLFLPMNRFHNSECCKKHATDNKRDYFDEYCMCDHQYVNRSQQDT